MFLMNKSKVILLAFVFISLATINAYATVYTFQPNPSDLWDLEHQYYYTWTIAWGIPRGEVIKQATLTFYNIYDWTNEPNDILNIHLLDNPDKKPTRNRRGVITGYSDTYRTNDNEGGGDNFAGQGTYVGNWTDPLGGPGRNINLTFDFRTLGLINNLTAYAMTPFNSTTKGNFGFGIDPDCHYYNNNITFKVTTEPVVPEPMSISLLSLGLLGLAGLKKRRVV